MCGILFVDLEAAGTDVFALRASGALASLSHRGPEAYAELVIACHLLSFHRLAIVHCDDDGMQPFASKDSSVAMVCSGEIYNYREIGESHHYRSDVDVVLHLHESVGTMSTQDAVDACARLDGDFAFVVTDGKNVVAARDPFGVRPLFYATHHDDHKIIAFASEAKALVGACFLAAEIKVFPPGHVCFRGEFVAFGQFAYSVPFNINIDDDAAIETKLLTLLKEAVEKRIRHSDQADVAVLCSGGIDSAAVTCIAAAYIAAMNGMNGNREHNKNIVVFTMRYANGHSDDAFYAELLCREVNSSFNSFKIRHETLEFSSSDLGDDTIDQVIQACETCDPNTIRAAIPMYMLAKRIREQAPNVKVVLSGEGADELFGGYGYFRFAPEPNDAAKECDRLLRNIHQFDLLRADRCFAAHGLEVRVPFLDIDLVRFVQSLPTDVRIAGEKQLLRDAVVGYEALKRCRVLDRPKEKFSDGAGFSYVPELLRRISSANDDGTLPSRLNAEAALYSSSFVKAYGAPAGRWVIERTMPSWTDEAQRKGGAGVLCPL